MVVETKSSILTIEDVNKTLEDSLQSVFTSDRFNELLQVMSKMKVYSINNTILIVAQRPTATMVMGFKEWQKLGRFVNKGEKGLRILAPTKRKLEMEKIDPETKKPLRDEKGEIITEKKDVISGFNMVSVFDVSQTDGKEIPSVRDFISREMENDEYMAKLYQDYKNYLVETKNIDIREADTDSGVGGYFNRLTEEIVISSNNTENDTEKFRVLIHEYAHSLLHHKDSEMKDLPRGHKEAQAESVAYVVSNYYGLDSTAVSAGYIATWSQDMKLAMKALEEIQSVANAIIDDVDHLQKNQIQQFYKDQTKEYEEAKKYLIEHIGISEDVFEKDEKKETQFQLINKDNGYIISGKLEYSDRNNMFYLRTNRNLIEPLSELAPEGKLKVLNVEKELDQLKEITEYSRIPEFYTVKKITNGPYVVQSSNGQDVISKGFEKREGAKEFFMRASISQSLHQQMSFKKSLHLQELRTDLQDVTNIVEKQINDAVGEYLSHHSKRSIQLNGQSGITVGWTLLKNPAIKTLEQLEKFADENKNVPSYTKLPETLAAMKEQTEKQELKVKKNHEMERTLER